MLTFIFFTHSVWSYAVTENKDTINHSNKTISAKSTKKNSQVSSQVSSYGEKVLIINPRKHTWAAYNSSGQLLNSGLATAGSGWCSDIKRSCRTKVGSFRIYSLGSKACVSTRYPVGRGGAPMPYCMFFNGNQGIHGSYEVVHGNISHGCVRVHVGDAAWIRFNFATIGTKVVVLSY
jgi:lipoprotein-anchoring transpeptidase ErfK/SrfK